MNLITINFHSLQSPRSGFYLIFGYCISPAPTPFHTRGIKPKTSAFSRKKIKGTQATNRSRKLSACLPNILETPERIRPPFAFWTPRPSQRRLVRTPLPAGYVGTERHVSSTHAHASSNLHSNCLLAASVHSLSSLADTAPRRQSGWMFAAASEAEGHRHLHFRFRFVSGAMATTSGPSRLWTLGRWRRGLGVAPPSRVSVCYFCSRRDTGSAKSLFGGGAPLAWRAPPLYFLPLSQLSFPRLQALAALVPGVSQVDNRSGFLGKRPHRRHPGIMQLPRLRLPQALTDAAQLLLLGE